MYYGVTIYQHNIRPHLDIEKDIQSIKNGLFTCTIRVNQGNMEDYVQYETVTIRDYAGVEWTLGKEHGFTYDPGAGSSENAVRPGQR